jgi:hypothetical protein
VFYLYDYTKSPDLDNLETLILESTLLTIYNYLRWDEECNKLKIDLIRQINEEEQLLLDSLVSRI